MNIKEYAVKVLEASSPHDKVKAAHTMAERWRAREILLDDAVDTPIPEIPGRPDLPVLVKPQDVKRRRLGSVAGRAALLHAIAHIEFNAINLAADMLARYAHSPRIAEENRTDFIDDWVSVCDDEARHFTMINERLIDLESFYGEYTAHNGLWEAAITTSNDLTARLVVAPMVLEARGLDVTPGMVKKMISVGDKQSAAILSIIYDEEIPHIAIGTRWFMHICVRENIDPETTFKSLVKTHYKGSLNPPFNVEARDKAGMPKTFYQP